MKAFDLVQPKSLDEAIGALPPADDPGGYDRVRILAGGQDLLGELKDQLAAPETLVNLKNIVGLDGIDAYAGGQLVIGALVTLDQLEAHVEIEERYPIVTQAARAVATPQIRNAATVGGNLCQRPRCFYYRNEHARCLKKGGTECFAFAGNNRYNAILGGGPSFIVHPSDLAPALIACDAEITMAGPAGNRALPLEEFYVLPSEGDVRREFVLAPNEIVTRVTIPGGRGRWRSVFLKVRERDSFDFALSAAAVALKLGKDQMVEDVRIVLGGVAPVPWRCRTTEELLTGATLTAELCGQAAEDALRLAQPLDQNGYKIPMTKALIVRALRHLAEV